MTITVKTFQRIETGLNSNQYCNIGVLSSRRIFSTTIKGFPQVLVLITWEGDYGEVWGHVFLKGERWVTILTSSDGNFKGTNDDELIRDYIKNVRKRRGWWPINVTKECEYRSYSAGFEEAVERLIDFIEKVEPDCYTFDCGTDETNQWLPYEIYGSGPLFERLY